MRLIADWKWVATKAWSMRLMALSAVLSGAEVTVQFLMPSHPRPWLALAAGVVTIAAAGVRLLVQREGS